MRRQTPRCMCVYALLLLVFTCHTTGRIWKLSPELDGGGGGGVRFVVGVLDFASLLAVVC